MLPTTRVRRRRLAFAACRGARELRFDGVGVVALARRRQRGERQIERELHVEEVVEAVEQHATEAVAGATTPASWTHEPQRRRQRPPRQEGIVRETGADSCRYTSVS